MWAVFLLVRQERHACHDLLERENADAKYRTTLQNSSALAKDRIRRAAFEFDVSADMLQEHNAGTLNRPSTATSTAPDPC